MDAHQIVTSHYTARLEVPCSAQLLVFDCIHSEKRLQLKRQLT